MSRAYRIAPGQMREEVTFVTPPAATTSSSHNYGWVSQEVSGTAGTVGLTVWARFEVLSVEDTIRAGGEAAEDMARVGIHYTAEATERKALRRDLDATYWDIVSIRRPTSGSGFLEMLCRRSK